MLPFNTHLKIAAWLFGALLVLGWGGSILQGTGIIRDAGPLRIPIMVLMLGLVVAFAYSLIPVMVMLVLGFQKHIGNENVPAVAAALKQQRMIIYGLWALMTSGLVIAVPAAIYFGAFSDKVPQKTTAREVDVEAAGPSIGTLTARPGMSLDDMRRLSSGAVNRATQHTSVGAMASGIVFDFAIDGSNITLKKCRYFTAINDGEHIRSISVGVSPGTMSQADLESANAELRSRLAADGWRPGREQYPSEEEQAAHGGATRGTAGDLWLKNGMVLHIERRRAGEPTPNENAATPGAWLQYIELWARDDYPNINAYVFAPGSD